MRFHRQAPGSRSRFGKSWQFPTSSSTSTLESRFWTAEGGEECLHFLQERDPHSSRRPRDLAG
ncbi:hypothetical protein KSP39_PZI006493 [Platanthera zijinensis]|uniref:Uncharacterized protein n=1 Tax=Platanthera zijinensis TaxID=2320716 RepID=A0AAP0BRZ4_9ASPA